MVLLQVMLEVSRGLLCVLFGLLRIPFFHMLFSRKHNSVFCLCTSVILVYDGDFIIFCTSDGRR